MNDVQGGTKTKKKVNNYHGEGELDKLKELSNFGSTTWIERNISIWLVDFRLSGLNFNNGM